MLPLNTTVTFSLRVPLGLGYTVLDIIRLPNVRLEMVALNKRNKNKQQNKANYLNGRKRKKWRLFRGWGGHRPAPLMKNWYKNKYFNHQKLFSFKTCRGNYPQFLWHVRYVNDLEYLSVSEQLNYNKQNISSSLIFFGKVSKVWSLTYGMRLSINISWTYFNLLPSEEYILIIM